MDSLTTDVLAAATRFSFGDTPEMADALLELVLSSAKTATCSALRDYGFAGEALPLAGQFSIVEDGSCKAVAVIEIIEVEIRRFEEIDAAFAFDEGEGDRTLEDWRRGHEEYFRRNGGFSPDMELVCERFRLVRVLD